VAGFLLMDALFNSNRSQAAPAPQAGAVAPAVPAPSDTAPAIAVPEGRDDAALPAPLVTDPVDEGRPFWAYLLPIAFWAMIIGGGIWLVRRLFGRRTTS
jgi:hypothetical protein